MLAFRPVYLICYLCLIQEYFTDPGLELTTAVHWWEAPGLLHGASTLINYKSSMDILTSPGLSWFSLKFHNSYM